MVVVNTGVRYSWYPSTLVFDLCVCHKLNMDQSEQSDLLQLFNLIDSAEGLPS